MKKVTIIIMLITILSKVLGFFREIILSYLFGVSNISDIYLISITIPNVIFGFVVAGISAGYIPITSRIIIEDGIEEMSNFTSNLINILLIICTVFYISSLFFTDQIVKIFAAGFSDNNLKLAVEFTRITMIAIFPISIIAVFTGYMQSNKKYLVPVAIGIPFNFLIICSMFLSKNNIKILPIGFLLASILQVIFIMPFVFKNKYKHNLKISFRDKYLRSMLIIIIPVIVGISANQINFLIDRSIASSISVGGISILNYSSKLIDVIHSIFIVSIITVLYPKMSEQVARKEIENLKKTLNEAIIVLTLLLIPTVVGMLILSNNIIVFLFGRGEFDTNAIRLTSTVFKIYSIGLIAFGFREFLSKVFYSLQNTITPMINGIIGIVVNIILNFILSKFWGIKGLAIATTFSAVLTTLLLSISLYVKLGNIITNECTTKIFKIVFASCSMGIITKISIVFFTSIMSQNIALFLSVLLSILTYIILIQMYSVYDIRKSSYYLLIRERYFFKFKKI